MTQPSVTPQPWNPGISFYIGLGVVMLALTAPLPAWTTFIHMWRVEIAASLFLICVLGYFTFRSWNAKATFTIPGSDWKLIILPLAAFILWSSMSAIWAESWKSAIHHSLIWAEYLAFFIIFRHLLERGRSYRSLLLVFVLTLLLYAVPATLEYFAYLFFGGQTTIGIRFAKYGEQIITILPLVMIGVVRMSGKRFAAGATALALLWLLVFCSLGRANYILFGAEVLIFLAPIFAIRRYRHYAPRFVLLIAIFAAVTAPLYLFSVFSIAENAPAVWRFRNTEDLQNSNNFRKLMISLGGEMIRANPIVGVGADNFGMQLNKYRERYGAVNSQDINLANAEDQIPSHAHNEFLQVAAELGLVGIAIFIWFLVGIGILAVRSIRGLGSRSLYASAAVLGLGMFLASSLVSSYSFRLMQNGILFFFVLAVASKAASRAQSNVSNKKAVAISPGQFRFACVAGVVVCFALLTYSVVRVTSVAITERANQTQEMDVAIPLYEMAMRLDNENPDARNNLGMRLLRRKQYAQAIPYLESAIVLGRASSAEFSYLATAKTLSGDAPGAENTMRTASEMYPRSPFVLTRYATLLESHGKREESAVVYSRASEINPRAALTWRSIINFGPKSVSELAARDKSYMQIMELTPESSIYAVVAERYIKYPEEQKFSLVRVTRE